MLIYETGLVTERLRVREIDDNEVRRLLRIVRPTRRGEQQAGLGESRCWLYREEDPALRHDLQAGDQRLVDPDLPDAGSDERREWTATSVQSAMGLS